MGISLNLSADGEKLLRQAFGDNLERKAIEALVLEAYQNRILGTGQVRQLLGLETRWDAEAWLASKGAYMSYSIEDLDQDWATIRELYGKDNG